ncbi:MAG: hypothetical protein WA304_10610 [Candidatus Cybelea sp.]
MRALCANRIERVELPASGACHIDLALGEEVVVDPTDTSEDLTAEELNATEPVIYRDEGTRIDDLRARVRGAGVKRVARAAIGVSLSTIQRFVNHATKLHASKLARIEAALQSVGA